MMLFSVFTADAVLVGIPGSGPAVKDMRPRKGTTLIELLVVATLIGVLASILLPALGAARRQAKKVECVYRVREIVRAVTCFAQDNNGWYPPTVATNIYFGNDLNYLPSPTYVAPWGPERPTHRAVSEYLGRYISDPELLWCSAAPSVFPYLNAAWEAGDDWDNPDTPYLTDSLLGTYCLWWGYRAYVDGRRVFNGPRRMGGRGSKLLMTDYFGYGGWWMRQETSTEGFVSCEPFRQNNKVLARQANACEYWYCLASSDIADVKQILVSLSAGYTDGHVGRYSPANAFGLQVAITPDGKVPHPVSYYGYFFVPKQDVR